MSKTLEEKNDYSAKEAYLERFNKGMLFKKYLDQHYSETISFNLFDQDQSSMFTE